MSTAVLTTFLACSMLVSAPDAGGGETESQIAKLSIRFTDAFVKGDAAFVNGILTDDWLLVSRRGEVISKQDMLKALKGGQAKYSSMDKSEVKVRVYGDAAIVSGRMRMSLTFLGQGVDGAHRFTEVYVKRGAAWRCASLQTTPILEAP